MIYVIKILFFALMIAIGAQCILIKVLGLSVIISALIAIIPVSYFLYHPILVDKDSNKE